MSRSIDETKDLLLIEPQPNIRGSYVEDGGQVHYCELDDMERVRGWTGPVPWHTIINPFGPKGGIVKIDGLWYWEGVEE